jgi:hypothetical protein
MEGFVILKHQKQPSSSYNKVGITNLKVLRAFKSLNTIKQPSSSNNKEVISNLRF